MIFYCFYANIGQVGKKTEAMVVVVDLGWTLGLEILELGMGSGVEPPENFDKNVCF